MVVISIDIHGCSGLVCWMVRPKRVFFGGYFLANYFGTNKKVFYAGTREY